MRYPVGYQRLSPLGYRAPGFFCAADKLAGWQAGLTASVPDDRIHLLAVSTQMVACRKVHTACPLFITCSVVSYSDLRTPRWESSFELAPYARHYALIHNGNTCIACNPFLQHSQACCGRACGVS